MTTQVVERAVVKTFYFGEKSREDVEKLAEDLRATLPLGTYLIKVWDDGATIGFFQVK